MDGDKHINKVAFFVRFDDSTGRTIVFKFTLNGWNSSGTTFCQLQFFQEIAKTAVAVSPRNQFVACFNSSSRNGSIGAWETENMNPFRFNGNFDRLILLIIAMIQRIHNRLFQSAYRIIEETETFRNIILLYDMFANECVFQISQCAFHLLRNTPVNGRFGKVIRTIDTPLREYDDIRLCILEELFRMFAKHHCSNILQHSILSRTSHQIHLFKSLFKRLFEKVPFQLTVDFRQIITKQNHRNIGQGYIRVRTFIKGNAACHIPQLVKSFAFRNNGACSRTNIISLFAFSLDCHIRWDCIGSVHSAWNPNCQYIFSVNRFYGCSR